MKQHLAFAIEVPGIAEADGEVGLAHLPVLHIRERLDNDGQAREPFCYFPRTGCQPFGGEPRDGANVKPVRAELAADVISRRRDLLQGLSNPFGVEPTSFGEFNPGLCFLEKLDAKPGLEPANVLPDDAVGHVQLFSRGSKPTVSGGGIERFERIERRQSSCGHGRKNYPPRQSIASCQVPAVPGHACQPRTPHKARGLS